MEKRLATLEALHGHGLLCFYAAQCSGPHNLQEQGLGFRLLGLGILLFRCPVAIPGVRTMRCPVLPVRCGSARASKSNPGSSLQEDGMKSQTKGISRRDLM